MHSLSSALLSSTSLRDRLASRLDQLDADRPDLASALTLQRQLLGRQIDLLDSLVQGGVPGLSLPRRYVAAKLRNGIPALHGEPVPLPAPLLTLALRDFCARLSSGATAETMAALVQAIDVGQLDAAGVLSACFGRDQHRVRHAAAHAGVSAELLWLVAELALAPFAHLLRLQLFERWKPPPTADQAASDEVEDPVADALAHWDRGFCPACGSWPALLEAGAHGHTLRCSFCAHGWELLGYHCLYCGNEGQGFITAAADPEQPGRRLQLCGACGGYVKALEMDEPSTFPLVAIDDLASLDLDMAAIERNYVRPALADIRKRPG